MAQLTSRPNSGRYAGSKVTSLFAFQSGLSPYLTPRPPRFRLTFKPLPPHKVQKGGVEGKPSAVRDVATRSDADSARSKRPADAEALTGRPMEIPSRDFLI